MIPRNELYRLLAQKSDARLQAHALEPQTFHALRRLHQRLLQGSYVLLQRVHRRVIQQRLRSLHFLLELLHTRLCRSQSRFCGGEGGRQLVATLRQVLQTIQRLALLPHQGRQRRGNESSARRDLGFPSQQIKLLLRVTARQRSHLVNALQLPFDVLLLVLLPLHLPVSRRANAYPVLFLLDAAPQSQTAGARVEVPSAHGAALAHLLSRERDAVHVIILRHLRRHTQVLAEQRASEDAHHHRSHRLVELDALQQRIASRVLGKPRLLHDAAHLLHREKRHASRPLRPEVTHNPRSHRVVANHHLEEPPARRVLQRREKPLLLGLEQIRHRTENGPRLHAGNRIQLVQSAPRVSGDLCVTTATCSHQSVQVAVLLRERRVLLLQLRGEVFVLPPQSLPLRRHRLQRLAHVPQLAPQRRLPLAQLALLLRPSPERRLQRLDVLLQAAQLSLRARHERRLRGHVSLERLQLPRLRLRALLRTALSLPATPTPLHLQLPLLRRQRRVRLGGRRRRLLQRRRHSLQLLLAGADFLQDATAGRGALLLPRALLRQRGPQLREIQLQRRHLAQQRTTLRLQLRRRRLHGSDFAHDAGERLLRLLHRVEGLVVLGVELRQLVRERLPVDVASVDLQCRPFRDTTSSSFSRMSAEARKYTQMRRSRSYCSYSSSASFSVSSSYE